MYDINYKIDINLSNDIDSTHHDIINDNTI